jgi:hypothetical protein
MFRLALATTLLAFTTSIAAQDVTSADLQALQDAAATVSNDITQARTRDTAQAGALDRELGEVRDDIAYLLGKLRREGKVSQNEVADVRTRIDRIRRAPSRWPAAPTSAPPAATVNSRWHRDRRPAAEHADVRRMRRWKTASKRRPC